MGLWSELAARGGPRGIRPSLLRELGIYVGSQGIFFDKERTSAIHPGGVTMSVLHTGKSYADDFASDGVLYHYPRTSRAPTRDESEVAATKAAGRLGVPVFVVTSSAESEELRDVHLGWVNDWDDEARLFLVTFGNERVRGGLGVTATPEEPFRLFAERSTRATVKEVRDGQQRFKFDVLRRYGPRCAVCDLDVLDLLDAAHLVPKAKGGSDHPANGLLLCSLHHRAFDAKLFGIDPEHLSIIEGSAVRKVDIRITRSDIKHLRQLPHPSALDWLTKHRPVR
jgi:hypothetical protein